MRNSYSEVLANRQFKRIWLVGLIAAVGDQIFPICATVILLNQGSGASEIAILMSARVIALLTLAPIGGVWADRLSRKLVIVSGAIIRSTLCFFVFLAGEGQSLYLLAGLVFLMGASEAFSGPAGGAIIPSVVDRDLLQSANALKAMSGRFASISGPGIAAGLIALIGPRLGFLLTSILFAIAALGLSRIIITEPKTERSRFFEDLRSGFNFIKSNGWMAATMVILALQISILFGAEMVLLPVITKEEFDSTRIYPIAIACLSFGSLLSSYLAGKTVAKNPGRASFLSWFFISTLLIGLIFPLNVPFVLICYFIGGVATQPMGIFWATAIQKNVPAELRGRVISLDQTLTGALVPLGMLMAGPISEAIGAKMYLFVALGSFLFLNCLALSSRAIARFGPSK